MSPPNAGSIPIGAIQRFGPVGPSTKVPFSPLADPGLATAQGFILRYHRLTAKAEYWTYLTTATSFNSIYIQFKFNVLYVLEKGMVYRSTEAHKQNYSSVLQFPLTRKYFVRCRHDPHHITYCFGKQRNSFILTNKIRRNSVNQILIRTFTQSGCFTSASAWLISTRGTS